MKIAKRLAAIVLVLVIFSSVFSISCFADGRSTISCKTTATVGETITVKLNVLPDNTDKEIIGIEGNFTYDDSRFSYIDDDQSKNDSGGNIKFAIDASSLNFSFKVISAGKGVVGASNIIYSGGANNSQYNVAGSSVTINITDAAATPEPAAVVGISSLRLSGAELSPAFSANVTSYRAEVKNSVEKINISAAPNAGCTVTGTGEVTLDDGENTFTVTATANDGKKKSYTIKIKRLTLEETALLEAQENSGDPLSVTVGEKTLKLVQDISALPVPKNFKASTVEYSGQQVGVLTDDKYILYYLSDESLGITDYYVYNSDKDEFEQLIYLLVDEKLYIYVPESKDIVPPEGYYGDIYTLTSGAANVYRSENGKMSDFCWINMYNNGTTEYYRYDTENGIIQRSPDFEVVKAAKEVPQDDGFSLDKITTSGKIIIVLIALAFLGIIALIILLIVKVVRRENDFLVGFDAEESELSMSFINSEDIDLDVITDNKVKK